MAKETQTTVWQALRQDFLRLQTTTIAELFQNNPDRFDQYAVSLGDLTLDFSKNAIDDSAFETLLSLLAPANLPEAMKTLFLGGVVNQSEQRAATHTQARKRPDLAGLKQLISKIEAADYESIVHIGVGGSDLGPRLLYTALKDYHLHPYDVHFVSELDASEMKEVLAKINPHKTLFIIVSKSFTTVETIKNAQLAKHFLLENGVTGELPFVAVTAESERAREWGVSPENILAFEQSIGGRFSLWTAVSLVVALVVGLDHFIAFLQGAVSMDTHFFETDYRYNLPVILALMSLWQLNCCHNPSRCIIPYSYRLRMLPDYLQQLHMESLGKSTQQDGQQAFCETGGVIWGKQATSSQHSFHQLFLQGNRKIPVDFILPLKNQDNVANEGLINNCLSQSELLARGAKKESAHLSVLGNVSHNIITVEKLTPFNLGALIALYEHKVFVLSVIWNINAFDQWGVEEGKRLARQTSDLSINRALYTKIKQGDCEVEYQ